MNLVPINVYLDTDSGELVFLHPGDGFGDIRVDVSTAATPTEDKARLDAMFTPAWRPGVTVTAGEVYAHAGKRYRIVQTHTTQAHFPPDGAGLTALYVEA